MARSGVATMFPQAIALAATFDEELIEKIGDVVSTEGRAKFEAYSGRGDRGIYKGLTFWAPNINIFRDPRWGRGHETYGEDPCLTAKLGCAYIRGIQGKDPDHLKAAACAKHFAVHSGPEALRHEFDAKVSLHDLYDTYLYAFKRCVKDAGVEAVMGAYNRVNGEPACGSKTLLQDILREQFGFEGHVVSDCWAILDFHEHHHVTKTVEESAAMAVNHGCDLNCGKAFLYLSRACEQRLVEEKTITEAVERLMDVRIRLGMMEDYPSPYANIPYDVVECPEHIALSLEASKRSMVLLKNDNHFLPLKQHPRPLVMSVVVPPERRPRPALSDREKIPDLFRETDIVHLLAPADDMLPEHQQRLAFPTEPQIGIQPPAVDLIPELLHRILAGQAGDLRRGLALGTHLAEHFGDEDENIFVNIVVRIVENDQIDTRVGEHPRMTADDPLVLHDVVTRFRLAPVMDAAAPFRVHRIGLQYLGHVIRAVFRPVLVVGYKIEHRHRAVRFTRTALRITGQRPSERIGSHPRIGL